MNRLALLAAALTSAGCVPAQETAPVIESQRLAATALAFRSTQDAHALEAATRALLTVRRAALVTDLDQRALVALHTRAVPAEDDWLERFANLIDHPDARRRLVETHAEILEFDQAAEDLIASLRQRAADSAIISADLLRSVGVLAAYADADAAPAAGEVLRELYTSEIRETLKDPDRRAAADRLIAGLLGHGDEQ